ncbi:MAG: NUDIX domain-containing protein [Candidatus Colwellbacteria bacterium]|nr:NUDIX domain-containing protein [Candidatus Colwellbacteria bacterium]
MPVERSAGAIIFRKTSKGIEYLLLHHHGRYAPRVKDGHWDFPKGHVERGEKTEDTVRREVKEETGLENINFVPDFKETIRYFININGEQRLKFVAFFLAEARGRKIKISREHQGYARLSFRKAHAALTYFNAKKILKKAHEFLLRKGL